MENGSAKYIDAITGLRTVSVLVVFLCHSYPDFVPGGFIGVDVFFVISGYLITSILLKEVARTGTISISGFYRRRALRILPASLFCTLIVYLLGRNLLQLHGENADLNAAASAFSFMNWLRAFTTTTGGVLGHYWSLAVEEQFYAFWSLIVLAVTAQRSVRSVPKVAAVLLLLSIAWRAYLWMSGADADRLYNGLDTHCDGLLIGCIIAGLQVQLAKTGISHLWPLAAVAFAVELFLFDVESRWLWLYIPAASLTAGLIVISAIAAGNPLAKLLANKPLVFLGKRSYSFYLWHLPVIGFFFASGISRSLWILPSLVLCLVLSELSYRLIERPFLQFKDRPGNTGIAAA